MPYSVDNDELFGLGFLGLKVWAIFCGLVLACRKWLLHLTLIRIESEIVRIGEGFRRVEASPRDQDFHFCPVMDPLTCRVVRSGRARASVA